MKASITQKLYRLQERYQELNSLLSDAEVISNQRKFRELSKEHAELGPVVENFGAYLRAVECEKSALELLESSDEELRSLAKEELQDMRDLLSRLDSELQILMLPTDPNDAKNVYLEIRGGAGGDEAAIFAGDLFRMYTKYAENRGWKTELVSMSPGEHGGYKEVITRIIGQGAYSQLKFESGAHRVQRVPETEAQGRVHTSTCTVAILPEVESIEEININPSDLRIDTYRSSGAGGQHVNTTDSAIRITHLPSGLVVECQDERSQHKNKAKALALLQARLLAHEKEKQHKEQASTRRDLVGTGDRSERIRTYNFPQGRLTDHRISLTLYQLSDIMEGHLNPVIQPLIQEHQADLLASMEAQ